MSAATGTGKTLIADYIIDTDIKEGKRVIYTAPIKALSNQKYKQFRDEYGEDKVGMMTGDIVINPTAQVLIMTTEIYRNMLMTKDPSIADVSYVIFDEIHFISDIERGTVWEESIIFSPKQVRFLCLSATIPNAREFADWIEHIQDHKVDVVEFGTRAVPLTHYVYDAELGITTIEKFRKEQKLDLYPDYKHVVGRQRKRKVFRRPNHMRLVKDLKDRSLLPCMFFIFSRMATEQKAHELSKSMRFVNNTDQAKIITYANHEIRKSPNGEQILKLKTTRLMLRVLKKGIAFHHAGVLPKLKDIVEHLFEQGLIKVLYATETFAVGINMPEKTVCFHSLDKFDGRGFRYLNSQEYFQIAGRAGRRGIDTTGTAIAMVERKFANGRRIANITTGGSEPIISQFKMSVNSVLNIIRNHTDKDIQVILESNLGCFQAGSNKAIAITKASYKKKRKLLEMLNYVKKSESADKEYELTWKGQFATHIYTQEMLVTEVFFNDLWKNLDNFELTLLVVAIMYEGKKNDQFKVDLGSVNIKQVLKVLGDNSFAKKTVNRVALKKLALIVWKWVGGCEFTELMNYTNLLEGDLIRVFRQAIDLMRQIRGAARTSDKMDLVERIDSCIDSIKRSFVDYEHAEGESMEQDEEDSEENFTENSIENDIISEKL